MRAMMTALFVAAGISLASEAATKPVTSRPTTVPALVPVTTFTSKDLPEPDPGKPAWAQGNQWSYGVAVYEKWVYAASTAEYVLQFEPDHGAADRPGRGPSQPA